MPRQLGKLTALTVQRLKKKGLHSDGGGLNLRITASGGKYWVYRFTQHGKAQEMGLGALHAVSLADARIKAAEARKQLSNGINPIASRDAAIAETKLAAAKAQTFRQCAEAYIEAHKDGWRNDKHIKQWQSTMETYVYPVFGDLSVQVVDVALVTKVLEPIWKTKTETASRVRGRIENILDWATAREYRRGENPARWRGHLENLLPARSKVQKVVHQPALPYEQIAGFMKALKAEEGMAAMALAFTILTAARTSEVIGATWNEVDLKGAIWTIPDSRIKGGREHRVPLSGAALKILQNLKKQYDLTKGALGENEYIFRGHKKRKPLSNMAMLMLLERMNKSDITVHGFRSSFRDWAAEKTHYPREVAESALAHISGDKVELAYRRGDLFEKRRNLMEDWAAYCQQGAVNSSGAKTRKAKRV